MSRSPKYSEVGNGELRRRRLQQEREARERARRAAEAQRAAARLTAARKKTERRLAVLAKQCAELSQQAAATAADVRPLTAALDEVRAGIRDARDADQMSGVIRRLDEIDELRGALELELLDRNRTNARQRLDLMRQTVTELSVSARRAFDPGGATEVDRLFHELSMALDQDRLEAFSDQAGSVLDHVQRHRRTVLSGAAQHAEQQRIASALLEELGARHQTLARDAEDADIPLDDLGIAGEAVAFVAAELDADRPSEAVRLGRQLSERLDAIERDLDNAINRISARRDVLSSIMGVLPTLGFAVDPKSLLETADGSLGVQANLRSGDGITVIVQDTDDAEHRISYLRDARAAAGSDDSVLDAQSCTSLAQLAATLNDSIRQRGFEPGQVRWDDDPGHRPPPSSRAQRAADPAARAHRKLGEGR